MKAKHNHFTKALSVIITAVMLFTTVSAGIILPETKIGANAATYTVTAAANSNTSGDLEYAIRQVNAAGSGTIKLGANVTASGLAAYTAITGNAIFDFNGYNLTFSKNGTLGDGESNNADYQIPTNNAGTNERTNEYLTSALIKVSSSGSLQIINSSSTAATMKAYAKMTRPADAQTGHDRKYTASANLIYSEGNVTIGDRDDANKNNFTLFAHAIVNCKTKGTDYAHCYAYTVADAVTINNANAKFKMYGGTINAECYSNGKREGHLNSRCYALNIVSCYCAEIYDGNINITHNEDSGLRNADGTKTKGGTAYFAAIRISSANVYIFNVNSSVQIYVTADTDQANASAMNIYVTDDNALPCIYGGKYENTSSGSSSNAGWEHNYTILGKFSYAEGGNMKPGSDKSASVNGNRGWQYVYRSATPTQYFYTVFYMADTNTKNGIYPWNYGSFREYLAARTNLTDAYYQGSNMATRVSGESGHTGYNLDNNYSYRRDGYSWNSWTGSKRPGAQPSGTYTTTAQCGFSTTAGGSMFLYPNWTKNSYTISYNFNDGSYVKDAYNYPECVSKVTDFPTSKTYSIDSTELTFGTPVRNGYTFSGWKITNVSYADQDTYTAYVPWTKNQIKSGDTAVGGGSTYGNLELQAQWTINSYTISYDLDGGMNPPADVSYTVEDTLTIPAGPNVSKENYDYKNKWKVAETSGSWIAGNTETEDYNKGRGNWGDVTLVAQYEPHPYTVTYNTDGGSNIEDETYKSYTIESTHVLPSSTKTGYNFAGWQAQMQSGSWDEGEVYPAGEAFTGKYGAITLKALWEVKTFTVSFDQKTDETNFPAGFSYSYDHSYELSAQPTKDAYVFAGWKVKSVSTGATWVVGDIYAPDAVTHKVTIPANKEGNVVFEATWTPVTYQISFNTNGGSNVTDVLYTITDTVSLPNCSKSGYNFGGWQVTGSNSGNWHGTYLPGTQTGKYGNVSLVAVWNTVPYTVTLDADGGSLGSAPATIPYDIESDETERRLPVPTKTGYTFTNWEVTATDTSGSSWTVGDTYTDYIAAGKYGDVTLTANWTPATYTIRFSTIGNAITDRSYSIEDSITLPSSECPGYTFVNWTLQNAAGNWEAGDYGTADALSGKYGNIILVANFTPVTYTITYNYADGTSDDFNYNITQSVTLDSYSYGGYTFGGWQVESCTGGNWYTGAIFEAGPVDSGYYGFVTLTPVLEANSYTLTFNSNEGTACTDVPYTIESASEDASLPSSVRNGYDLQGWEVTTAAGNWQLGEVFAPGAAVTGKYGNAGFTAVWTPKNYNITWITGSGTTVVPTPFGTTPSFGGSTYKAPDEQYSYTFRAWNPSVTTVSGDATYTAQYDRYLRSYTITWVVEPNETETTTTTATYSYGDTPVYNNGVNPVKTSSDPADHVWRFTGWDTEISTVTGAKTYTAQYKRVASPRTVTWIVDGVSSDTSYEVGETPEYGSTPYKAPTDGYEFTFTGWSPAIVPVAANTDYIYTAQFSSTAKDYTAIFDADGGTLYENETDYNRVDGIRMPSPTRNGYVLSGWKVTRAGGTWTLNDEYDAGEVVTDLWGSVTFTAQWTLAEYTVTFSCAEGTAPADITYTTESTATIPACTREGYEMTAYTVTNGTGSWTLGTTISVNAALTGRYGDVTLSPIWYPKTYTITWISGATEQEIGVQYGAAISALDPIAKAGYTAVWDNEIPETMPASDLTFTAQYSLIEYSVRVIVNGGEPIDNFTYNIETDAVLPTPVRAGTTFDGWRVTIAQGNWTRNDLLDAGYSLNGKYGNITITAEWTLETHTVTFIAGDITKETEWYHGSVPFYNGTPVKSSDDYFSYVFSGWDRDFEPVTSDTTYTALFTPTDRVYTITWNIDNRIVTQSYNYGELPEFPENDPTKASTELYDFTFAGWDSIITPVTADKTYFAQWDIFTKLLGLSLDVTAKFLKPDESDSLTARIYPSSATARDIVWTSNDTNIVSIDNEGRITAVNPGVTLVRASSNDGTINAYCLVNVEARHTSYVTITSNGVSTTNLVGSSVQLYATVMPDNATNLSTVWSSSNPTVASVDSNGLVTYMKKGTATITCNAADGYALGTITVTATEDAGEVQDEVKTHLVMFLASSGDFIIGGQKYGTVNVVVADGEGIQFKTEKPDFVLVDGKRVLKDDDGFYRITNITKNYTVLSSPVEYDIPDEEDAPETIQEIEKRTTFFERLQAFFRSIVQWFRSLFGKG